MDSFDPDSPLADRPEPGAWGAELEQLLYASTALAVGRFTTDGDPVFLNPGMRAVLGDEPLGRALANPSLAQLLAVAGAGPIFDGLLSLGDGYRTLRTLRGRVYRRDGELLICAEHDVLELDRLERELSRTNQHINNLQRELIAKNARLTHTLAEAETQLQVLRDSEERLRRIVAHIADPVLVTDTEARIRAVNPAFSRVTGYAAAEVLGQTPKLLASGRHPPAFYAGLRQELGGVGQWRGIVWNRRKDGSLYVQRLSISALRDSHNEGLYVGVYNDIDEELRALEQARFQAEHDALTGLPNRVLLLDRLGEALRDARRRGTLVGVLFIDLDRFKPINDTHGHATGDTVLQIVARRFGCTVRDSDTVARLGGDEFVVVLRDLPSPPVALKVAEKLGRCLARPIRVQGLRLRVGASIGMAVGPQAGEDAAALIVRADAAMYDVKRARQGAQRR